MNNEKEMSFEELYQESLKDRKLEKTVTGKIISITSKGEIFVDIGYKADGIIPKSEYSFDENIDPKNEFNVGDEISADVIKLNDGIGNVLLSYKRAKLRNSKKEFEQKVKNKDIFESKILEVNKNGLITKYNDIRIFIPLSLSGISKDEQLETYIGKDVKYRIIEHDFKNNKIIGSIKNILDEQKIEIRKQFWDNIEIGKKYEGIVTSLSTYGAFVEIEDSVQGLLHVSQMSWSKNIKPEDIVKQGQKIEVTVIDLDKENKRLKLSYGDKGPNPWNDIDKKYKINDIIKVKIAKIMPFGAFAELEEGIEGLIHISQISNKKIAKPEEVISEGQQVEAKIIEINKEQERIELSIKQIEEEREIEEIPEGKDGVWNF